MTENKDKLNALVEDLKQQRDELRVQLNLAKAEAGDEWEELERKFSSLESKLKAVKDEAADSADDVFAAARLLGEELGSAFKRIKNKLD